MNNFQNDHNDHKLKVIIKLMMLILPHMLIKYKIRILTLNLNLIVHMHVIL